MPFATLEDVICLATLEKEEPKPEPPAPVAHLIEALDKAKEEPEAAAPQPSQRDVQSKKKPGRKPYKKRGEANAEEKPKPKKLTDDVKDAICESYLAGVSHTKNAETHGVLINDIFTVLRERELIDTPGASS